MRKWWRSCLTTDTWDQALPSKRMVWRHGILLALTPKSVYVIVLWRALSYTKRVSTDGQFNQLLQENKQPKSVGKEGTRVELHSQTWTAGFVIRGNESNLKIKTLDPFFSHLLMCIYINNAVQFYASDSVSMSTHTEGRPRLHYWIIMNRISLQLPCLTTSDLTSWFLTHCLDRLLLLQVLLGFLLLREFLVSGNKFFFVC